MAESSIGVRQGADIFDGTGYGGRDVAALDDYLENFAREAPSFTAGIDAPDGVVARVGVKVHLIRVADRIGLQEAPEPGRVHAGLVVPEAEFGYPRLARESEAHGMTADRVAPSVIARKVEAVPGGVDGGDDAALVVRSQMASSARGYRCTLEPSDRVVDVRAVDVALDRRAARSVVLRNELITVVQKGLSLGFCESPRNPARSFS